MLNWNELRITPDGKFLIIDVEVQNLDYFKDVYLESLQMNVYSKAEDFIEAMPDSKSISLWEGDDVPRKRVRKYIDIDSISDLFKDIIIKLKKKYSLNGICDIDVDYLTPFNVKEFIDWGIYKDGQFISDENLVYTDDANWGTLVRVYEEGKKLGVFFRSDKSGQLIPIEQYD